MFKNFDGIERRFAWHGAFLPKNRRTGMMDAWKTVKLNMAFFHYSITPSFL
jgi:hypothetical protein